MEIYGNPITGYTTEYYSKIIESVSNRKNPRKDNEFDRAYKTLDKKVF